MMNPVKFQPLQPLQNPFEPPKPQSEQKVGAPTFLDVYKSIVGGAAATQEQKSQDMLDLMLGDVDDLERIQSNITKAQISLELLVNVRNVTLEAYNEIIKMSI
ncbi:MAG: flagellar hook-basal body complex protein FliE [Oscillospiraceae bacterium]|jgi:flagellar hook-basal body complex protein FliE|nr:flagellar hook-basal body complex protein FliE [Oscillospiraceae bacterium]